MATAQLFEVDTKGTCLLCLKPCENNPCDDEVKRSNAISFKMLLRYLKIDLLKLHQFSSTFLQFVDGVWENVGFSVTLCEECGSVTRRFLQLFQDYDVMRVHLDMCAGRMHSLIKLGEGDTTRLLEFQRRISARKAEDLINASFAESLRKETRIKCALRLNSSVPKVKINASQILVMTPDPSPAQPEQGNEIKTSPKTPTSIMKSQKSSHEQPSSSKVTTTPAKRVKFEQPQPKSVKRGKPTDIQSRNTTNPISVDDFLETVLDLDISPENNDEMNVSSTSTSSSKNVTCIKCDICGKNYTHNHNLQNHRMLVHPLVEFSSVLPSAGTTEEELTTARDEVVENLRTLNSFGDPRNPVGCSLCPERKFKDRFFLKIHVLRIHFEEIIRVLSPNTMDNSAATPRGECECPYCPTKFSQRPSLITHLIAFHPLNHFSEQLPDGTTQDQLNTAIEEVVSSKTKVFADGLKTVCSCSLCDNKEFPGKFKMRVHIIRSHFDKIINSLKEKDKTSLECPYCSNQFKERYTLKSHLISTHTFAAFAEDLPSGTTENELKTAIDSVVEKGRKIPHERKNTKGCPFCVSKFQHNYFLRTHILKTHFEQVLGALKRKQPGGLKRPPIVPKASSNSSKSSSSSSKCFHCGKRFVNTKTLGRHIRAAHTIQEYASQLPPGTSQQELELALNSILIKIIRHDGNDEGPLPMGCPICLKTFRKRNEIRDHVLRFHFNHVVSSLSSGNRVEDENNVGGSARSGNNLIPGAIAPSEQVTYENSGSWELPEEEQNLNSIQPLFDPLNEKVMGYRLPDN